MKKELLSVGAVVAALVFVFLMFGSCGTKSEVGRYTFSPQGLAFDTATGELWRLQSIPETSYVFWERFGAPVGVDFALSENPPEAK